MGEGKINEIEVGQAAPDFVARDLSGKEVRLSDLIAGSKALLVFYRGGWCPFCNQQLAAITADYPKFKALGAIVVFVSGEEVENGRDLLQRLRLPFILLSDTSFKSIDLYGVRYTEVPEALKAKGIFQLPKPSAFVIDSKGIVRHRYVGKNASDRPKNGDLLGAIQDADKPMAGRA